MRVLSMLWIVLGHSFLMAASTVGYSNPLEILDPESRASCASRGVRF